MTFESDLAYYALLNTILFIGTFMPIDFMTF